MNRPPYKTLILCTGNSARSIIGEYLLRTKGKGRFETFSAGAKPTGQVNPLALWVLKEHYGVDASDARSKSWDEFANVKFDFVITVCDNAKESCPVFLGHPTMAHFGSPDPADCHGTDEEKKRLFVQVASQISRRLDLLCSLPDHQLEPLRIRQIGGHFPIENDAAGPATP
ncbi:MAG TPA: arsenate reductase ArsC [Opitutaceae bacterium]|jgi:arsenate reductase